MVPDLVKGSGASSHRPWSEFEHWNSTPHFMQKVFSGQQWVIPQHIFGVPSNA
tara:strand:+ start:1998 stop:2156 length:159 start_codon:yes stop_codon:yes gene_type:complete